MERKKYLAVAQVKEGLCKTWDRRTETGWEVRGVRRQGWDGHEKTADALTLLLTKLPRRTGEHAFSNESSCRLREAAALVKGAMQEDQ